MQVSLPTACSHLKQHTENEPPSSLKPMNCPAHVEVFNSKPRTYKDLPLRFSEFGSCCRYEPSGALFGTMRLRNFTQDDGHIFCRHDQVRSESKAFCSLLFEVYKQFGFTDLEVRISTRPENFLGDPKLWSEAEQSLEAVMNEMNIPFTIQEGEGAFYGPKIEFILKDALQRTWQCGTLQLDYVLPERLGARYIDENKHPTNTRYATSRHVGVYRALYCYLNRAHKRHPTHVGSAPSGGSSHNLPRNQRLRSAVR